MHFSVSPKCQNNKKRTNLGLILILIIMCIHIERTSCTISLVPNDRTINAITTYNFTIIDSNLNSVLDPTAYIEIVFNTQFFNFTLGSVFSCYFSDTPSTVYICQATASNIIRINNPLFSGSSSVWKISIVNIKNPPYTVKVTFTYNFRQANTNIIRSLTSLIYSSYLPGALQSCSISFSPSVVFTQSILTVTIRLGNQVPTNGTISVIFPTSGWIDQANSSYSPFMPTSTRTCTKLSSGAFLNSVLPCISIYPVVTLQNSLSSTTPSGSTLSFSISSLLTPPTTSISNSITIRTQTQTIQYYVDQTICVLPSMSSRNIDNLLVTSVHTVGSNSSLKFEFTAPTSLTVSDRLIISSSSPNDTFFNVYSISTGYIQNDTITALLQRDSVSTTINSIMMVVAGTGVLVENLKYQLKEGFFLQPLVTSGKRSLKFSLRRNNSLIALNSFEIDVQPNVLSSLSITMDTSVVSTLATYTFAFNLFNALAINSRIIILLPSQLSTSNGACTFSITLSSTTSYNNSATCSITSNRTITISSLNINQLNSGERISISIGSILNSQVAQQTNAFIISTYSGDSFTTATDISNNVRVSMTAINIGTASINSSSPIVAVEGVYTLSYTVRVKYLPNAIIQLKLPPQITYGLNTISAVFNIKYINNTFTTDQSCSVTNFTLTQIQYLQFSGISSVQLPANTIITIKISSLVNPLSLRSSSSFGVYQMDFRGFKIEELENGLFITNTQTNQFNPIYAVDSAVRINGQQAIFNFNFQTFVPLSINDFFQVQLQLTNNPDTQIFFSGPMVSTDISYPDPSNPDNSLKISNIFERRSSILIKISLLQALQAGKTYTLSLNTIIRSRCGQTPGTITLRSYKYVTSTQSFGISSSSFTPSANIKQNVLPKISLNIISSPSQLFSFQQFSIQIQTKNPLFTRDYYVIQVPSLYLYVGNLISVTNSTNLSDIASQSLCSQTLFFCSHFDLDSNRIKVQQLSSSNIGFSNTRSITITIKNNLYRSPSTFNYKGYYFNAKTYSSTNKIIDGSSSINTIKTDYTSAQFYLSCNINIIDYHCQTCNTVGVCLSCYQPININSVDYTFDGYKFLTSDQKCVANCSNGYFINTSNNLCTKCDSPCATCQNTAIKCLSCIQTVITNKYYSINKTCLNLCPIGYYADLNNICTLCSTPCATCVTNAFTCLSCISGTFLNTLTSTCVTSTNCPSNTYADTLLSKCLSCDISCNNCISSSTNCLLCSTGYIIDYQNTTQKNCTNRCPVGTVNDTVNNLGCRCQTQCKTCSVLISTCTSCDISTQYKYLYSNTCVTLCPQSTYLSINTVDSSLSTCIRCAENNCKTCTSLTCTECIGTYLLYQGACITQCPSISVLTITNGIRKCLKCLIGCINCDKGINQCSTCQSGYLKQGNTTNTYCVTTCSSGYVNFNNVQCYTSCPAGYQNINNICTSPNGNNPINNISSQLSTTKSIPFPFVISAVILISCVILCKLVLPYTLVSTLITSIIGLLQVLSWMVAVIVAGLQTSNGKHWDNCQNGVYLLIVTLVINMGLNCIAMYFFAKYVFKDVKFNKMIMYNNKKTYLGKCPLYLIFILSIIISHKILQIIFSNFIKSRHFSYKVNIVTNLVPLNYILFISIIPSILAIIGGSIISYQLQIYKIQSGSFIASVDMIIVTVIGIVTSIWVSNRNQNDYQQDIFNNQNGDKNYQTEEIFVQGNHNHQDMSENINQVFMEQSGIRKTNMSMDKQKNYYYKSSRLSNNDQDHINNPLTKRKNTNKPINNNNITSQHNNMLRNTTLSDQHSSEALIIEQMKKRRNLKDQFTPENQLALNSKQDIQVIQFNHKSNNLDQDTPLKAIHYNNKDKIPKPEQLSTMSSKQKQLLKQRIQKQLSDIDQKDKQKLNILTKQRQLRIKKQKQKIQKINEMSQKQISILPDTQKQKVNNIKNAVDLLKRKQIKIEEYLLYNQIIKQEQGQYDEDELNQNGREISVINQKNNKQQDDNDLQQVINLSPKRRNQESPMRNSNNSPIHNNNSDRSQNSKQKTIKKQLNNKKKLKSNKKNSKLNDLHVFYKYQQNDGQLNLERQFNSQQQPQLPKIKSNIIHKNKNNKSQKNIDMKKNIYNKNNNNQDILMIEIGSGRYQTQGEGLQDQYGEIVPPKFLHSTQKIQNNNKSQINFNNNKINKYQTQNDKQTKKSYENNQDYIQQISPSRFDIQNQRMTLDQQSDLPTRPRIGTTDSGKNNFNDSKYPTKRINKHDGFGIYEDEDMIQEENFNSRQIDSRMNQTMNRYQSAHHLDYDAILRKNQQNQKLKRLEQIYLPRQQAKYKKRMKKDNTTSRNSRSRDRL